MLLFYEEKLGTWAKKRMAQKLLGKYKEKIKFHR